MDAVLSYRTWHISPLCRRRLARAAVASLSPIPTPQRVFVFTCGDGTEPKVVAWDGKFGHLRAMVRSRVARSRNASVGSAAAGERASEGGAADDTAIDLAAVNEHAPLK